MVPGMLHKTILSGPAGQERECQPPRPHSVANLLINDLGERPLEEDSASFQWFQEKHNWGKVLTARRSVWGGEGGRQWMLDRIRGVGGGERERDGTHTLSHSRKLDKQTNQRTNRKDKYQGEWRHGSRWRCVLPWFVTDVWTTMMHHVSPVNICLGRKVWKFILCSPSVRALIRPSHIILRRNWSPRSAT